MIKINLIALRVPKEHRIIQKQVLSLIAGGIGAVLVALWGVTHASAAKSDMEAQLETEKGKLARLESVAKRIEDFEKKRQRREQILETIKKLEAKKIGPRPFLDDLNMLLPADIWLTEVSELNLRITISGYSFSNPAIADLMRSMESSLQFADVELAGITNEVLKGENVKRFTISCNWEAVQLLEDKKETPPAGGKK